jgi:hypothetical protein
MPVVRSRATGYGIVDLRNFAKPKNQFPIVRTWGFIKGWFLQHH